MFFVLFLIFSSVWFDIHVLFCVSCSLYCQSLNALIRCVSISRCCGDSLVSKPKSKCAKPYIKQLVTYTVYIHLKMPLLNSISIYIYPLYMCMFIINVHISIFVSVCVFCPWARSACALFHLLTDLTVSLTTPHFFFFLSSFQSCCICLFAFAFDILAPTPTPTAPTQTQTQT